MGAVALAEGSMVIGDCHGHGGLKKATALVKYTEHVNRGFDPTSGLFHHILLKSGTPLGPACGNIKW